MPGTGESVGEAGPRPMIVADDAHVTYRVYASGKRMSARESLFNINALRGGRGLQTVPALRGVSFTASEGETIGVIGHNGSGKSTLFRAMSGLIPTSEGKIWAADRPVLLGVNAALVPELSGENNIKLGLLAMGFTPDEAAAHVDEIADFAELNEFLYHPMRTYSSGMGARLRFAIASAKAHSILLIDEALSVGDRRFKLKSEQRIRSLRDNAGLVMIVSHSVGSLKDTCDRVLWIHKGELRADGDAKGVIDEYVRWTKQPGNTAVGAASAKRPARPAAKAKPAAAVAAAEVAVDQVPAVSEPARSDAAATPQPVAAPAKASEPPLSPFEQLLIDAAVDAKELVVPTEGVRTTARRDRYRRGVRERNRRIVLTLTVTGIAILLAIGAGAAIALLSGMPQAPDAPNRSGASSSRSVAPVISGFAADTATVACETPDAEASVRLSWEVGNAAEIGVGAAATQIDAIDQPLETELPSSAANYAALFPCDQESWSYTLTAQGSDGSRVDSVVTVTRALAEATDAATDPEADSGDTDRGAVTPPDQESDPVTDSGNSDTSEPAPDPSVTPDPIETPDPVVTPDPAQTPTPTEPTNGAEPTEPATPTEPTAPVEPDATPPADATTAP